MKRNETDRRAPSDLLQGSAGNSVQDIDMGIVLLRTMRSEGMKNHGRLEQGFLLQVVMSNMVNEEYRRSRGTDKPFTLSDEQAKAIWNEQIRKEKPQYYKKPSPVSETSPKV